MLETQVKNTNAASAFRNERIIPLLEKTTGQKLGKDPQKWWGSWMQHNETMVPKKKPVVEQQYARSEDSCCSCFAKGTLVWTKTGLRD